MSPSFSAPLLSRCLPLFPALTLTISNACPRETVQSPLEDTPCPFLPVYAPHERKRNFRRNPVSSAETPSGFCVFPHSFSFCLRECSVCNTGQLQGKRKMQGAAMSCLIPSFNCSVITCLNAHSWRASLKKKQQQQKSILFKRHSRVEKHCGQAQPVPRFKKSNKWNFPSVHLRTMIRSLSIQNKKAHFAQASDVWIRSGGQKSLQISLTQCHFSSRTARRQRNLLM